MISWAIRTSLLDGVANPTPELEPSPWPLVLLVSIWSLRPITWPAALISGPPELPGLIGASVWIAFGIVNWLGAWIVRLSALMMPAVTVLGRPNGLPMAITLSPTWTALESPNGSGCSSEAGTFWTRMTARSAPVSEPTRSPAPWCRRGS